MQTQRGFLSIWGYEPGSAMSVMLPTTSMAWILILKWPPNQWNWTWETLAGRWVLFVVYAVWSSQEPCEVHPPFSPSPEGAAEILRGQGRWPRLYNPSMVKARLISNISYASTTEFERLLCHPSVIESCLPSYFWISYIKTFLWTM